MSEAFNFNFQFNSSVLCIYPKGKKHGSPKDSVITRTGTRSDLFFDGIIFDQVQFHTDYTLLLAAIFEERDIEDLSLDNSGRAGEYARKMHSGLLEVTESSVNMG
ncbi:unnamed protein product [Allacma fusca]|uniref:Uncharacterized protein n=1 Tax=Allacma fusca TaxID=39272 RepID=A0A8J2JZP6_9HEXA|nr:unnamed protein product [Allacma fusca]